MYTDVSEKFKNEISKTSRTFKSRIKINGKWYTNIKSITLTQGSCDEDNITIGSAVSSYVEVSMKDIGELFENTEVELQQGLMFSNGSIEYITMGYYTAQRPQEDNGYIKFTAYDRMQRFEKVYTSKLTFPATAQQVLNELCNDCGIATDIQLETVYIQEKPQGYTCREVVGYIASLYGKFAIIERTGKLAFKFYEVCNYDIPMSRTFSLTKNQTDYKVEYLYCNIDSSTQLTQGSGSRGITFDNPYMTKERLAKLYDNLNGFTYRPATIKFLGDIRLDVWDIVKTTDLSGNTYNIPVMKMTQTFDGGVCTTIEATGKTEEEVNTDFKGPITKGLERTYTELLLANTIIASKVDADWVKANTITTEKLEAVNAEILNLKANKVDADWVKANTITTDQLTAVTGRIQILEANSLTVNSAEIKSLKAGVADINTLMFGTASGGSLTTEFSNSIVGLIGDAQIKSAMIKDISADKILSGKLYTNLVQICSQSGNLDIADNTIQIRDSKKTPRVQIGKDGTGDYNIYIWDKNGKLMFDPLYGIQADGIKKAIIRNDMISDNANISGEKIDIASLITNINADGSHTLNASKIYVDTDKQTLDVSFKKLTTNVSTVTTSVTTAINTANTANTTANNATTTANSAKSTATTANTTATTAKNTADAAKQTATTANNTANTANGNANSALSKANLLEANLKTVTEKVTTQGTQLTAIQGNISSKIWQQDITTAVTTLEIGGRNLYTKSQTFGGDWGRYKTGWTDAGTYNGFNVKTKNSPWNGLYQLISAVKDEYYTISAYVKVTQNTNLYISQRAEAKLEGSGVPFIQITAGSWKRVYKTVKVLETGNIGLAIEQQVGGMYICGIKLEKGVKATDWTPATEDVDSSIAALEGSTTTLSNQYTSLNQTLTSLSATVNSNTTAITKKADGSTVTSLQNKVTNIQADLSGYKTTVANTYATKSSLNNYATTTAVNSAIDQKANSITQSVSATYSTKTELNNLQIGGTNLLKGTDFTKIAGIISTTVGSGVVSTATSQGDSTSCSGYSLKITRTDTTTTRGGRYWSCGILNAGEKYTWSFYAKGNGTWDVGQEQGGLLGITLTGSYKRYTKTFTANSSQYHAFIFYATSKSASISIYGLKLEQGDKATSWTPAPEDMATKASLELKIDKTDNNKIISMINASADAINLTSNRLTWTSTNTSMTKDGKLTCSSGKIGGFDITATGINAATGNVGMNASDNWAFYAGNIVANTNKHVFCVGHDGNVYAQNATISGTINATAGSVGGYKITSNYLMADTLFSDNYVRRVFIQKPTSANSWVYSIQKGVTTGASPSQLNSVFNITAAGELYQVGGAGIGSWLDFRRFINDATYHNCGSIFCNEGTTDNFWVRANMANLNLYSQKGRVNIAANSGIHINSAMYVYNNLKAGIAQFGAGQSYTLYISGGSPTANIDCNVNNTVVSQINLGYHSTSIPYLNSTSDLKCKTILKNMDTDAIKLIMSLRPIEYYRNDLDDNMLRFGFGAQEVFRACNMAGIYSQQLKVCQAFNKSDGRMLNKQQVQSMLDKDIDWKMSYEELIAPLVYTVQQLYKQVEQLKQQK